MHLLFAPIEKFGALKANTALLINDVRFFGNVALCPNTYHAALHLSLGCKDITPHSLKKINKQRQLGLILFLAHGGLGDCLWLLPLIKQYRIKYPAADIRVIAEPRSYPLFQNFPYVNMVLEENPNIQHQLISSADEVIDLGGIVTMNKKTMNAEPVESAFKLWQIPLPKMRADFRPQLILHRDEGQKARETLEKNGVNFSTHKIIVIATETSTANRDWGVQNTFKLSNMLTAEGYKVIWLSDKSDVAISHIAYCDCGWESVYYTELTPNKIHFICPACLKKNEFINVMLESHLINLAKKTTIREAMAIIALSDLVICPNSGLMVIATALKVPTIGLFGAFENKLRTKYYDNFLSIQGKNCGQACNEHWTECKLGHPAPCMRDITPAFVFDHAVKILSKLPPARDKKLPTI